MIFFGCDGGSTKAEFIITEDTGKILAHNTFPGCNFARSGYDVFRQFIQNAIRKMCGMAGIQPDDITDSVFGLTAYGELESSEEIVPEVICEILPKERVTVANDAVIGWSGSISNKPNINVVAGTGSIAYGEDESGNNARVGGWSLLFGDEGSCCWIGRHILEIFFKQSDGRLPRTALYDVFREYFNLSKKDLYFIDILNHGFEEKRTNIANLQLLAEKAYKKGDKTMKTLYSKAADELAEMAQTVKNQLSFRTSNSIQVSYSGGLFKSGDLVLTPFREKIEASGLTLVHPKYPPFIGALAIGARKHLNDARLQDLLELVYKTID